MAGVSWAEPVLVALIAGGGPLLTLWFARRDKRGDERKTQGQQFVDNLVADNSKLRQCVDDLEADKAKLENDLRAAVKHCEGIHGRLTVLEWAALRLSDLIAEAGPVSLLAKTMADVMKQIGDLKAQVQ